MCTRIERDEWDENGKSKKAIHMFGFYKVELLLCVTLEYKVKYCLKTIDLESSQNKCNNILADVSRQHDSLDVGFMPRAQDM